MITKLRITIVACLVILPVLLLAACATTPPTQEMSDARQSVQAAFEVGADELAPENLAAAREYLAQAERELELRFFSRARHDALIAKNEAIKAHKVSLAVREARDAISRSPLDENVLEEARELLAEAETAATEGRDRSAIRFADEARRIAEGGPEP